MPLTTPEPAEVNRVKQPHVCRAAKLDDDHVAGLSIEVVIEELHDYLLFLLPYGDWFVGFNDTFSSDAFVRTAASERPSLSPMLRVGVF